ncbi:hypothetical protein ACVWYQ_006968 [Bradyrhizobium sp. USDA 3397]
MKDLTHGSIASHILSMAPPIMAGMISIMILPAGRSVFRV